MWRPLVSVLIPSLRVISWKEHSLTRIWLHQDNFTNWEDRTEPLAEDLAFCFGFVAGLAFFEGAVKSLPEALRLPISALHIQ
jgi:hypothetical protein